MRIQAEALSWTLLRLIETAPVYKRRFSFVKFVYECPCVRGGVHTSCPCAVFEEAAVCVWLQVCIRVRKVHL